MMPIPAARPISPALRKEIVITETSELDCITVVLNDTKRQRLPQAVGRLAQQSFQQPAGEGLETLFERQHAEQEDRHAGGDLFEVRTNPETVGQHQEDGRQQYFLHHWP